MDDSGAQGKIDALVANFFSAFDNRDGATPCPADLIDCFTEKATIVRRSDSGVELYTVKGEGHQWPGGKRVAAERMVGRYNGSIDATRQMWAFFREHQLTR